MRRLGYVGLAALTLSAGACDLTDVTIADLADIVVAEVYVTIGDTPNQNAVWAFIHGSAAGGEPSSATYDDAVVTVIDSAGTESVLSLTAATVCVVSLPPGAGGSCFSASVPVAAQRWPTATKRGVWRGDCWHARRFRMCRGSSRSSSCCWPEFSAASSGAAYPAC